MTGKITAESAASKIQDIKYVHEGYLTFCIITMRSGFVITGQSACNDPASYSRETGERNAYKDAFGRLFLMERYAEKDRQTAE